MKGAPLGHERNRSQAGLDSFLHFHPAPLHQNKSPFSFNVIILAIYPHRRRFTYTMPHHTPPSSASFLLTHLVYKSTRPISALRRTRLWRTLISRNGTCDTSRRHTSHHDSFYRTRDQTSLLSQGISLYWQRDGSRLGPTTGYPIPGRGSTRAPIRTDGPSVNFSWHRLWKHRPRTDTTKHSPTPLNPTQPKSCLKKGNRSRSCLPNNTSQRSSTKRSKNKPRKKKHTRRGPASTSPRYTDGRPSRRSHRKKQDGWTRVRRFFSRSRNLPSRQREKTRRTQTSHYHKSRRESKKRNKDQLRGPASEVFHSIHPRYTRTTRHGKIYEERSPTNREKGHKRHNREVTDRHTSQSVQKQKDTRPSMRCTEQRTTHRRAMHPSKINDWCTADTVRTRTHRSRALSPDYGLIPTTRKTKAHRYR
jgi:hypothetical protein